MIPLRRAALLALSFLASFSLAQETTAKLTHDQAVKDAKAFLQLLETAHPDPYTNLGGKIAFKRQADKLVREVPATGLSIPELADRLASFTAPLKDGHTRIRGAQERWRDPAPRLAVQFQIASDGLLVSATDLAELKGTRGYKLISVGDHSIPELLKAISAKVATENTYGAYLWLTEVLGSAKLLRNLIPDLDPAKPVMYTLQSPAGRTTRRNLPWGGEHPKDPLQWSEKPLRWSGYDRSDDPFYYRFFRDGKTAYLRVATMMPREGYEIARGYKVGNLKELVQQYYASHKLQMPADLEAAIQGIPSVFEPGTRMLEEMKRRNTPNLIIDFRGNTGGSTPTIMPLFYQLYGDSFFGRNSEAEFLQVRSQLYLDKYNSTVEKEKQKNPDFELGAYVFNGPEPGNGEEKRKKKLAEWKDHGLSFVSALEPLDGKPLYAPRRIIVLCDPLTFSAAFQATFILHEMGAKIVGVPPAQSPNAFMEGTPFQLTESGIKGIISNGMQIYLPREPKADVLRPDFQSTLATFEKYGGDEDTSLRYALDLIAAGDI